MYNAYTKTVDKRSRKAMAEFLSNHFRYYTMNSWNGSQSWANNVKIYNLDVAKEIKDKLYELLDYDGDELRFDVDYLIEDFRRETGYSAGFNGRSGGYLVMYCCENQNGKLSVYPGRSVDGYDYEEYMDKDEFTMEELKAKVELVQRFDELCNDIIATAIQYATDYEVVEEEIFTPKTVKALKEVTA